MVHVRYVVAAVACCCFCMNSTPLGAEDKPTVSVTDAGDVLTVETPLLSAKLNRTGYVTGIAAGSLLDKTTGARDIGYGLDIIDWIMEPGSDEAYREKLPDHMVYEFNNSYHGKGAKRSIEGPQICTKAGKIDITHEELGDDAALKLSFQYNLAAPEKKTGSQWTQRIVFPHDKRYFISSDRIDAVNSSDAMFLRLDMPGHIKHSRGDTFSEVYLSYIGRIPAKEFFADFAPDEKFNYQRAAYEKQHGKLPERMIRAYRVRDPKTGQEGPWLAGMTLDPSIVSEAWCHQRGYICMIEEFGGRPVKAGESFSAAFIVGWFDSIEEMEKVYDQHKGASQLEVTKTGWKLVK